MAVTSHNIMSKCERAIVAYITGNGITTAASTFPAKKSLDKPLPCTIVMVERAVLIHPYGGVYELNVAIMIKTDPCIDTDTFNDETPRDLNEERVSNTFDLFQRFGAGPQSGSQLGEEITQAGKVSGDIDLIEFSVQDCSVDSMEQGFDPKGNSWIDTINLKVVCCPAAVL